MKFFLYSHLSRKEKSIQAILCLAISLLSFWLYFENKSWYPLASAVVFLVLAIYAVFSARNRKVLLGPFFKAKIHVETNKEYKYIYSSYKKYLNLLVLLLYFTLSTGLVALMIWILMKEEAIDLLILCVTAVFSLFSLLMLVLIYFLFLPKVILRPNHIAYQQIEFKKYAIRLFDWIPIDHFTQIELGRFKGYGRYDSKAKRSNMIPQLTYHWILYGVQKNGEVKKFMDFDHAEETIIFSLEWEKNMKILHEILKTHLPHLTFNLKIRELKEINYET